MKSRRIYNRGFTFMEMALTLFSVGFLLSAVPGLLSKGSEVMGSAPGATPVEAAEFSLDGFLLMNNRLPCPSTTPTSGTENCGITKGFVPYRTLGLPKSVTNSEGHALVYGILANDTDNNHLGKLTAKYTPQYLVSTNNYWEAAPTSSSNQINGLDFCAKLRSQAALPLDAALLNIRHWSDRTNAVKMTNVAWVLVDPGSRNADGTTGAYPLFDGSNAPSVSGQSFESPSRVQSETYDDKVRAGTLTQMFGKLRCQELLASVSAAAREADFANDNWRVRKYLYDFRSYELEVRKQKEVQANNTEYLAIANVAANATATVLSLGIAYAGPAGATAIATAAAPFLVSLAASAAALVGAESGVTFAEGKVAEGESRKTEAAQAVINAAGFRAVRKDALLQLDSRGWFQ